MARKTAGMPCRVLGGKNSKESVRFPLQNVGNLYVGPPSQHTS